ncbi:hypothetical protein CVT26_000604 [Gymnopilus dilepis]|uniref:Protein kinase domain-containing protein n=1 Tax=Gymnopilus dilepis TaxID=231916 RepID=A0A409WW89_9AGAR|nr:hypothetical protein CVT26_000604 [Gymnopilus dilepis]
MSAQANTQNEEAHNEPSSPTPSIQTETNAKNESPIPVLLQRDPPNPDGPPQRGDKIGPFTLITVIGQGTTGEVWKARHDNHPHFGAPTHFAAVKIVSTRTNSTNPKRCLLLSHMVKDLAPRALPFLCVPEEVAILKGHECIISRLYATDLAALINNERMFPLPKMHSTAMIWQVLKGLHYLHSLGITHGDIKPGNILLKDSATFNTRQLGNDGNFYSKVRSLFRIVHHKREDRRQLLPKEVLQSPEVIICDLDDARLPLQPAHQPAGTPSYRAPEMVDCLDWNNKVDIFATACVAFELLTRRALYPEQRATSPNHVERLEILSPAAKWALIPDPSALDFIQKSTNRMANKRPTARTLLAHAFFGPLSHLQPGT